MRDAKRSQGRCVDEFGVGHQWAFGVNCNG
jgi:hypothetical protein